MAVVSGPTQFWIYTSGLLQGPFTIQQIHSKLTTGEATWGTKVCPVGDLQWRPLHSVPGLVPAVQRPAGSQPIPAFSGLPPLPPPGSKAGASNPTTVPSTLAPPLSIPSPLPARAPLVVASSAARVARKAPTNQVRLIGVGVVFMLLIGAWVLRSIFMDSLEGFERGYGDTVLRYVDRPYDGAKWTRLKETTSFAEMVTLGNTPVSELAAVAGWNDNNLWVANEAGQVFQLHDGHWQFAAKPDMASNPYLRALDQSTVLIAGSGYNSHLYRLSPGNIANVGEVDNGRNWDVEMFQADRDVIYSCRGDVIRFVNSDRTVLKVDNYKEAIVHTKDNTPLKEYHVGSIRYVRQIRPGVAFGVSSKHYGNGKKKLVKFENALWIESADLPDKEIRDLWLTGSADAPHVVLVGKSGWIHAQSATGNGTERTLATSPDPTKMNLIKVWGASPERFWVMDEHGTVWELNQSDSRIVVRGMKRDDINFKAAWVSPTGAVFAITNKHLYRLD